MKSRFFSISLLVNRRIRILEAQIGTYGSYGSGTLFLKYFGFAWILNTAYYLRTIGTFTSFFKDYKSLRNQGFSQLLIEGSGSWRPKYLRILRIRNTVSESQTLDFFGSLTLLITYVLLVHLHHSSKIISHYESPKPLKSRFFSISLLVNRRIWILEAQILTDPTDPEHWF